MLIYDVSKYVYHICWIWTQFVLIIRKNLGRKNSIITFFQIYFFGLTENISFHPIPLSRSLFTSIEQKNLFFFAFQCCHLFHTKMAMWRLTRAPIPRQMFSFTRTHTDEKRDFIRWRIRTNAAEIVLAMQNHVECYSSTFSRPALARLLHVRERMRQTDESQRASLVHSFMGNGVRCMCAWFRSMRVEHTLYGFIHI